MAGVALLLAMGVAVAQALPAELDAMQARMPQDVRERLLRRQVVLDGMNPAQRNDLARRIRQWDAQYPRQRETARARWQAWQALTDAERAAVRTAARRFAVLPVHQQQILREQFAAQSDSARRGWLLGPMLGVEYAQLEPLLSPLPAEQRDPLLRVLREMTPAQRSELGVLAQRIPPQQRDQVRGELLATPPEQRDRWLQRWLNR